MNLFCIYLSIFFFVSIIMAYNMHTFCTLYRFISKHLSLTTIFDIMECATSPEHSNSELNLLLEVS